MAQFADAFYTYTKIAREETICGNMVCQKI